MSEKESALALARFRLDSWLSPANAADSSTPRRAKFGLVCALLFMLAFGVRLLYWQDSLSQIIRNDLPLNGMTQLYEDQAKQIREQGGILYPAGQTDTSDARMVAHPPGYSILMAAVLGAFGGFDTGLRVIQILADASAAVIVMLIAAELFPLAVAIIAGTLVALSPHFAYFSMLIVPDSMVALPILLAVYLIIRATRRPGLLIVIAAGALVGLSCWLRSNALMLAPFLVLAVWLLFDRTRRLRYSVALIAATILAIAPITLRNWIVYHEFIPISLGAGITFMKGIADYDEAGRFGLPLTDGQTVEKEAEWYGKPEYARHLWVPDGVERERDRFARGLSIVRENPGWFLTVMLHRMGFMLRYNDFRRQNIRHNTTIAPTISASPNFGHGLAIPAGTTPMWFNSPEDLMANGTVLSPQAEVSLANDGHTLQVAGDDSEYGTLFASAPIAIHRKTDYVLTLSVYLDQEPMAVKVQAADPRIILAIVSIPAVDRRVLRMARRSTAEPGSTAWQLRTVMQVPFASGDVSEVRAVFSNNGVISQRPLALVDRAEMFEVGPTPHLWTRYPRAVVRAVQNNLYKTERLLPLVIIGVGLLVFARRRNALVTLLVVPCYYLLFHSAFHTEYRYILAMHYFLFVIAAVTLYCAGAAIKKGARLGVNRVRNGLAI